VGQGQMPPISTNLGLVVSVFFAPASYRLVKIVHSCFELVLRTKKHTMVYPGSDTSLGIIALHIAV
jgi:hypothetical protein